VGQVLRYTRCHGIGRGEIDRPLSRSFHRGHGGADDRIDVKQQFRISYVEVRLRPKTVEGIEHIAPCQSDLSPKRQAVAE
jgi:hypothetical protein